MSRMRGVRVGSVRDGSGGDGSGGGSHWADSPGGGLARRGSVLVVAVLAGALACSPGIEAQSPSSRSPSAKLSSASGAALTIVADDGRTRGWTIDRAEGHAAVEAGALEDIGWRPLGARGEAVEYQLDDATLELRPGLPLVRWNDEWVQLVAAPYLRDGRVFVPIQLLNDVLPDRLPVRVAALDPLRLSLRSVEGDDAAVRAAGAAGESAESLPSRPPSKSRAAATATPAPSAGPGASTGSRVIPVVVLDAGHGGRDPGSIGPAGTREKDVALALALRIRDELERTSDFEVHLTRDDDQLVPLWERGVIATRLKGDRPGIFISIHTNAVGNRGVRGFETYFLAEARTEHERRVAALENEAASFDRAAAEVPGADGDLGFILSELSNLDHIHWSSDLAAEVQTALASVHPGPDRGVKQGPLAVITNALMPAVLIEAGFISNPGEEQTLADASFQEQTARAVAGAVVDFFDRYPPGRKSR